jgi:glycosyltransferase involved in cell wall biosynthesis
MTEQAVPELPKTILIFTDWYVPGHKAGGPIQSIYNLANILSRNHTVRVVCRDRDLNAGLPYPGINCNVWTQLGERHFVMYLDSKGSGFSSIKQIIKLNENNILYINGLYSLKFSFIPALLASYFNIRKCFISVRGMLHQSALSVKPFKKQVFLAFARGFGLYSKCVLLASGEREITEIRKALGKVQIRLAPNIPMLPYVVSDPVRTSKCKPDETSFLCLGRIAPEKNPLAVLRALKSAGVPCRVTFCGSATEGTYYETFRRELAELPVSVRVQYIQDLPHDQIPDLLGGHDFMILPSLGENFGHAIFESFVYAVPVIIGNNTPWTGIQDRCAGIETDPADTEAIAAAIRRFSNMGDSEYSQWSAGARTMALAYFESNNFEDVYTKLFS